ncbi:proline-rich transmembrane protein 3 [Alligator mississippiensis]|uniref:proline-rich transmembrane protein 3 n=1 Tax=Alligator mississippiensis TaxID=8496 RepID=UPI0028780574|nr:proline-rich transmembrane protein 3 [Alligator mississippiensis]XP_059571952.1 proline-rich transmembrane protein 3 [Alligator mississippiensis]
MAAARLLAWGLLLPALVQPGPPAAPLGSSGAGEPEAEPEAEAKERVTAPAGGSALWAPLLGAADSRQAREARPGIASPWTETPRAVDRSPAAARTPTPRPSVSTVALRGPPRGAEGTSPAPHGAGAGLDSHADLAPTSAWTEGPLARPRSTRGAPARNATATPAPAPAPAPGATSAGQPHARPSPDTRPATPDPAPTGSGSAAPAPPLPGTGTTTATAEDIGSPQRVRGAVGPRLPANATATPAADVTPGTPRAGPSPAPPRSTPRRGLIRVSTQRALPPPPDRDRDRDWDQDRDPGRARPGPTSAPPNATRPRWAELPPALRLAWALHVYGAGALFALLSLGALAGLAAVRALRPPHLRCVAAAHALLLGAGLLRAAFLLLLLAAPHGRPPPRALLLLHAAPLPLLLGALAALLLRSAPPAAPGLAALLGALCGAALLGAELLGAGLGALCGAALLLAGLAACWRRRLRALAGCAALGLPCCALQACGALWLCGAPAAPAPAPAWAWGGWAAQLGLCACELALAGALLALAARACGAAEHACWAKAARYLCAPRKAAAPLGPCQPQPLPEPGPGPGPRPSPRASLSELELRPPSPISLSRSIDEALCRRHLLRRRLFPSPPGRPARRRSLPEAEPRPGGSPRSAPRSASLGGSSLGSLSRGSLQISWDPWRHGRASLESLAPRAPHPAQPPRGPDEAEREARRSFVALSRRVDSHSLSSDTIEL